MKTFLTADYHLGEDRFHLMGRPFETKDEHINHLVDEHNKLVSPEDEVIIVGDVCYQKSPESLVHIERFNGKKTLIRGNHDRVFTDEQLRPYFHTIVKEGDGIYMTIMDIPCYLTHYPTQGKCDVLNIVGHIHSAWKFQLNMINIGVDVNHFRPIDTTRIPFFLAAISTFYDDDVWVATNEINSQFNGLRGKVGSYFDKV